MKVETICDLNCCTGCMACLAKCPHNAIEVAVNDKGFEYPHVNQALCVGCGVCKKICPQLHLKSEVKPNIKKVYAAFSNNKEIRKMSSSGGLFTELASSVIQAGGVIFASKLSDSCKTLKFEKCTSIDELGKFRGSKYLQSSVGTIYSDVENELKKSRKVMFIGTACQVDGLKKFLGKEYESLLTVDIICHGVPSPKLWSEYLYMLEEENNSSVEYVNFRYKKPSWTQFSLFCRLKNGRTIIRSKFDDPYLIAFLKEMSIRENCYSCPYTNTDRVGNITLADFWGYKSTSFRMRNTEKGISLVLINSERGMEYFNQIKDHISFIEKGLKEAISGNRSLKEPWKKNPLADKFWNAYLTNNDLKETFERFCRPYRFPIKMKLNWFILNHLYIIPRPILRWKGLIK